MAFRVVDFHKLSLSVSKIVEQGHTVISSKEDSYIGLAGGDKLPLRKKDGVFELEVPVKSPHSTGPSIK